MISVLAAQHDDDDDDDYYGIHNATNVYFRCFMNYQVQNVYFLQVYFFC